MQKYIENETIHDVTKWFLSVILIVTSKIKYIIVKKKIYNINPNIFS